jgi:hypothetical protein
MKIRNILFALSTTLVLSTGCKKELELKDPQALSPQDAFSTDGNIKKVLQGGYDALSSGNLWGGNLQMYPDLMGSNGELNWVGTFNNYREVWGKSLLTTNTLVSGTWSSAYNVINIANGIIANIAKVATADQGRVKGEALFLRGAMHFELVRLYAKDYTDGTASANLGVPLMTNFTASTADITKPARNTVEQVYTQVIADLTEAETLLPASNTVFATKAAAAAILSRVYLQKADYAGARDAANRTIISATSSAGGSKTLLTSFMANFNQAANTAEDIFAIQVNDQDGTNNMQTFYSVDIFGARDGDIEIEAAHLALYELTDGRRSSTSNPSASTVFNTAFYTKYSANRTTKFRDLYKNVKVIRLAEMYLTRAEANYRLGTTVGDSPLNDVNRIRARAGGLLPLVAITSVNEIYLERRRELAFEGFGLHDAKRFKRTIDGRPWNDNKLVFPIPFREINANSSLVQNAGY